MAEQTLDQFTAATAAPSPEALLFLRDPNISAPLSRAYQLTLLMSAIQRGLTVKSMALSSPTTLSPVAGDAYVVNPTGTGGWAGQDNAIAFYNVAGTSWDFITPAEGWRVFDQNTDKIYDYSGSAWIVRQASAIGYDNAASGLSATDAQAAIDEIARTRDITFSPFGSGSAVTTGNGTIGIAVPATLNGTNISAAVATVHDKGVTGTTDIQIRRRRAGADVDVLSTVITIGDDFFAADGVIDASNDDLATGDVLYVDIDAVHSGTAPNGLSITITATTS